MFISPEDMELPKVKARPPVRGPSGFFEGIGAAFTAEQMETNAWDLQRRMEDEQYGSLESDLRRVLGDQAVDDAIQGSDPNGDPTKRGRTNPRKQVTLQRNALLDLAGASGDASLPSSREAIEALVQERYRDEYEDAAETMAFMRNGRGIAEFFGRGGAAISDPTSLVMMGIGGPATSLVRTLGREALLGAAGEALVLPRQYAMAEYLDIEDPNAAAQIGLGALFAGGIAGGGKVATAAGRRQVSAELKRAMEFAKGRMGPWRAAEKSAVDAAEDALLGGAEASAGVAAARASGDVLVLRSEDRIFAEEGPRPWEQEGDPGFQDQGDEIEAGLRGEVDALRSATGGRQRPLATYLRTSRPDDGGPTLQIHPEGEAAAELRARGITARTMPGLFSRNGRRRLDNLVAAELEERFPGLVDAAGIADDGTYLDEQGFLDVLSDELNGVPRLRNDLDLVAAESNLDAYLRQRDAQQEVFAPLPDTDDVTELQRGMENLRRAVDDHLARNGLEDVIGDQERGDLVQALAERGGSVDDALDAMDRAELQFATQEGFDGRPPEGRSAPLDDAGDAAQLRDGAAGAGQPVGDGGADLGRAAGEGPSGGPGIEQTAAGQQLVTPGVDPITARERLEAQLAEPLRGGDAPADVGLFDMGARSQLDMFTDGAATPDVDSVNRAAAGELRDSIEVDGDFEVTFAGADGQPRTMPASRWLDELDDEEAFVQLAEFCAPNRS
ncbi:MAG: hypothetical protein GYB53_18090 [Rhodobacteraceae bacterium]|nr:hypothetical protein [Paracoccaceae bacterium]MBR9823013.1 hypothetical protein [Paracoccaceae bacterium]